VSEFDASNTGGATWNNEGPDANARFPEDNRAMVDVPTKPRLNVDRRHDEVAHQDDEIDVGTREVMARFRNDCRLRCPRPGSGDGVFSGNNANDCEAR
jgi:hypothetical protein